MMLDMKLVLLLVLLFVAWVVWRAWNTGPLPETGSRAPDFSLADQNGSIHSLADYSGRWLVLYFYPKDDTPGCTREACSFRDGLSRLEAAGASVVGISVDSPESHREFAGKYQLPFDLLADTDGNVARKYGALMDWKWFRMSKRMTFLISPAGTIQHIYTQVDPNTHASELLENIPKNAQ